MRTLEQAIVWYDGLAKDAGVSGYKAAEEINSQLAAWLRELQERRKADSCEGCVNESKPNLLVCYTCRRHYHYADLYKERRTE